MTPLFVQIIAEPGTARYYAFLALAFALGACLGSFLNVVVFRLPAGQSVVRPRSRCPKCGAAIRGWHNIPILSWLLLRGRCYDCREPISARYPLVELVTGLVFLALAWGEPLADARNLPDRLLPAEGMTFAVGWSFWHLWGVYALHVALLFGLLAMALIEYDGHATPRSVVWPIALAGAIAPLFYPWLRPVPAYPTLVLELDSRPLVMGLIDGLAGAAVGLVMGLLASPATQLSPSGKAGVRTGCFALVSLGLILGWQAAAALAAWATILFAALVIYRPVPKGQRFPFAGLVALGTLPWILAWRRFVEIDHRFGSGNGTWLLAGTGGVVLALSLAAHWVVRQRRVGSE